MKKIGLVLFFVKVWMVAFLLFGCVGTQPRNESEMFPTFNSDPESGIWIIDGEPSANIQIYDQANRLFETWSENGASPIWRYNGQTRTRIYKHRLPLGSYRVEVQPFYYISYFLPPIRDLQKLPTQIYSLTIDRNPQDYYDYQYTRLSWGWILYIHTGYIPPIHYQSPSINIQGTGIMEYFVEWLRRR